MPICQLCGNEFPNKIVLEGKDKWLYTRKYCLTCSPWGRHNTRQLSHPRKTRHKTCADCLQVYPIESFPWRDKGARRRSTCKTCTVVRYRRYDRQKTLGKKAKAIRYLGGQCKKCGRQKPDCVFDFHHRCGSDKELNISRLFQRKWEIVLPELRKCDLLCANCHREIHYEETDDKKILEARRRKEALIEYKGSACVECGYVGCAAAFDFHHVNPTEKLFKIARKLFTANLDQLKSEVDKCVLLCACCHRIEHQNRTLE